MTLSFLKQLDDEIDKPETVWAFLALPFLMAGFLFCVSLLNYAWFHSLVELVTVVIGIALYLIARYTFTFTRNTFLSCIAVGYFWSAVIDVFHLLTFEGMGQSAISPPDTPPLLWMCARSLQASAFLLAPLFLRKNRLPTGLFALYGASAAVMVPANYLFDFLYYLVLV